MSGMRSALRIGRGPAGDGVLPSSDPQQRLQLNSLKLGRRIPRGRCIEKSWEVWKWTAKEAKAGVQHTDPMERKIVR
jgi:hypothetical protein